MRPLVVILLFSFVASTGVVFFKDVGSGAAAVQSAYRWRNDDGTQATATFSAAENAPFGSAPVGTPERLRFGAANSGSESELLAQAALTLGTAETQIQSAVIDTANGFAYFATSASSALVIKVNLATFTKVGTLALPAGASNATAAAIDTVHGFAYFGTSTSPGRIVKVDLSTFTVAGTLVLPTGENLLLTAAIDATGSFAYFGANTSPGKVAKIDLSSFTEVGTALTFASGENGVRSAVIDGAGAFAYFGLGTTPGKVVKVNLSTFTEVAGTLTFATGENILVTGVIDSTNGFAYFGTTTSPGKIVKVNLSTFTEVAGTITLASGENSVKSSVIDVANGFAYFGLSTTPGKVVKVNLSTFAQSGSTLTLGTGENGLNAAVIDTVHGFAYFGTNAGPPTVVSKVTLSSLTETAVLPLEVGDNSINASAIDTANGFAYLASGNSSFLKIDLATMTRVGYLVLASGENFPTALSLDLANGFAYVGLNVVPGKVAKINLSTFTEVGAVTFATGEDRVNSMVIDTANGFLYAGTNTTPGRVVKINLSTFTEVGAITASTGENVFTAGVIDPGAGFAYFVGNGNLVKVNLSSFTRVGAIAIGTVNSQSGIIDTANGFAYFGSNATPGAVKKVNLSTFTLAGTLTLATGENQARGSAIDTINGFAYFTTSTNPVRLAKINLSTFTEVGAALVLPSGNGSNTQVIDPGNGYDYVVTFDSPGVVHKVSIAPRAAFRLEYGVNPSACSAVSSWIQVPATASSGEAWQMANSSNITDGEATTNVASGLTDGNTSFKAGKAHDASSQTASISLGEREFTELEYSLSRTSDGTAPNYCFRLTNAGVATAFTYNQYAEYQATTPTLDTVVTGDNDADGQIDRLVATFSEDLDGSTVSGSDFSVSSPSYAVASASETSAGVVTVVLVESGAVDTGATPTLNIVGSVSDTIGDAQTTGSVLASDGVAPILLSAATSDGDADRKIDAILATFSEDLDGATVAGGDFTVTSPSYVISSASETAAGVVTIAVTETASCDLDETPSVNVVGSVSDIPGNAVSSGSATATAAGNCPSGGGGAPPPAPTPAVAVASPNGGETLTPETNFNITWSTVGRVDLVNIHYSLDAGANWTPIALGVTNTGNHLWTVPNAATTQGLVRVQGTDGVTVFASDASDGFFSIAGTVTPPPPPPPPSPAPSRDAALCPSADDNLAASRIPFGSPGSEANPLAELVAGSYVRTPTDSTVYFITPDLKRHPILDARTFFTRENSFGVVLYIRQSVIETAEEGAPVLPAPGSILFMTQSDPAVYALVEDPADPIQPVLRKLDSEAVAAAIYGADWAKFVVDYNPAFFTLFKTGGPVFAPEPLRTDLLVTRDGLSRCAGLIRIERASVARRFWSSFAGTVAHLLR